MVEEMNEQLDQVWQQVLAFKLDIKDIMKQGLVKIDNRSREERSANIKSMWEKLKSV